MAGLFDVFGGKVSPNLLNLVPEAERGTIQDQAGSNYWRGFLATPSGSGLLARLGNADTAAQGTVKQYLDVASEASRLAEAKRQAQNRTILENAATNAITGPQVNMGGNLTPVDDNGNVMPGVSVTPGGFNYQAYIQNPAVARALATDPKTLEQLYGRQIEFVNGVAVDKRNVQPGFQVPKVSENMVVQYDAQGRPSVVALPGAAQAVGTLEGAKFNAQEGAKARFDLVDVTLADGSKVKVPRAAVLGQAATGQPMVAEPSPAVQANLQGYKTILDDAYKGYQVANSRASTLTRLSMLADKLDTNSFTGARATIQGYLNAMGITGDEAKRFLTDVTSFRQGLNDLAAANFKDMTGAISNFDVDFTLKRQPQLTDVRESNQFNLAVMQAQDERKKEFYRFIQKNPTPDAILRWEESEQGKRSIYESPKLRKYLPQQVVQSGPHKGKTAYILPDGSAKVFD